MLGECIKHLNCSGVIPADLRSRVSGRRTDVRTMGQGVLGGLDFLFTPRVKPRFWTMLIRVA